MNLRGAIVARAELSACDLDAMYALMVRHYDGVERGKFLADLAEKDGALLLRGDDGSIRGFSSYRLLAGTAPTGGYRALFSGDTIVDARAWGSMVTLRTLGTLFGRLLAVPGDPLYWLLLSKGIRTYLLLPLMFRRFCPGGGPSGGSIEHSVLEHLARERFGAAFCAATSVVRPAAPADRLKPEWARVSPARLADPDVRFFMSRNPGHVVGDELVSIARIAHDNLTDAGQRLVRPPADALAPPFTAGGAG